ncbi:MAG: CoA ester lyase [Lachnospiraceae bacterium]|nr:CoA ester lyase [Lachnospiraceae bacterium]
MLLRSLLFVPAYNKKFLDSSMKQNADALIFDLEDSVPYEYKAQARVVLKDFLNTEDFTNKQIFIRLNPVESDLLLEDLKYVVHKNVTGFVLSKIYTAEDIEYYENLISELEKQNKMDENKFVFLPLIETTSAVLDVYNIARASTRIVGLAFGGEDFLNDLQGLHGEPPIAFDYPRAKIALAARAAGVLPIDTPYLDLHDDDGYISEEKVSFEMGFAGCLLIHPSQIELANKIFVPTEEEIQRSREIFEAIKEAEKNGSGVAMLNGKMIGPPMRKRAQKVLELVRLIEEKNR